MVVLCALSDKNFREVIALKANEKDVAPNVFSLAEAYLETVVNNRPVLVYVICADDSVIGFAMANRIAAAEAVGEPELDDHDCYWISRFMIGEGYQRRGFGRQAFGELVERLKAGPQGPAEALYTSTVPANPHVAALYKSFGFEETGKFLDDEIVLRLEYRREPATDQADRIGTS